MYRLLNSQIARQCDQNGNFLPPDTPPLPRTAAPLGDWSPFNSEVQFELADLLYRRAELSTTNVEDLLELWARSLSVSGTPAPFRSCREMHTFIDSSMLGDSPWQCLVSSPDGVDEHAPGWKRMSYEVWYRNPDAVVSAMLDNPDFDGRFDLRPYIDLGADGRRRWSNVMSGNIAWRHCVSWVIPISWWAYVLTSPHLG
jgi:Plavaka transposase